MGIKLLENKKILVTGANRGIGFAVIKTLISEGAYVLGLIRDLKSSNLTELNTIKNKHPNNIKIIDINIEDEEEIKLKLPNILKEFDCIDGLVNNAGKIFNGLVQMTPKAEFDKVFNLNFYAPLKITQMVVKKMIKKKSGRIVNISSTSSEDCAIGRAAYSSSKGALEIMTKT